MFKTRMLTEDTYPDLFLHYQRLRHRISTELPYFFVSISTLTPIIIELTDESVEEPKIITVDPYWRVYFTKKFFSEYTFEEQAGLLLKNLFHVIRLHFLRGNRLPVTADNLIYWLIACDLEVNWRVPKKDKLALPLGSVFCKDFGFEEGLLAEDYFRLIDGTELEETIDGLPFLTLPGCGQMGSGISGIPSPWDIPANSAGVPGVFDAERITKSLGALKDEAQANKGIGTDPLLQELEVDLDPDARLSWEQILPYMMRRAAADFSRSGSRRTFRRPHRRAATSKVVLPRLITARAKIGVVIDTSGSMEGAPISKAYGLVRDLCLRTGHQTTVICCDADAGNAQEAFSGGAFNLKLYGGGGTDMGAGIKEFEEMLTPPNVVVVITDGHTPWPAESEMPTNFTVVVVIVGDGPPPPEHIKYVVCALD